jgi:hypothetical protein
LAVLPKKYGCPVLVSSGFSRPLPEGQALAVAGSPLVPSSYRCEAARME